MKKSLLGCVGICTLSISTAQASDFHKLELDVTLQSTWAVCRPIMLGIQACKVEKSLDLGVLSSELVSWARKSPSTRLVLEGQFSLTRSKLWINVDGVPLQIGDSTSEQEFPLPPSAVDTDPNVVAISFKSHLGEGEFSAPDRFSAKVLRVYLKADLSPLKARMSELDTKISERQELQTSLKNLVQLASKLKLLELVSNQLLEKLEVPAVRELFRLKSDFQTLAMQLSSTSSTEVTPQMRLTVALVNQAISSIEVAASEASTKDDTPVTLLDYLFFLEKASLGETARSPDAISEELSNLLILSNETRLNEAKARINQLENEIVLFAAELTHLKQISEGL
jgi:hypothetical protein